MPLYTPQKNVLEDLDVSVALCTYNGMPYIREQLQSIVNQKRTPDEIVICDDRSTDGTVDVLHEFNSEYDNIKLTLNSKNIGINKNFEKCINLCQGDVIAVSDQDDIWLKEKLSRQVKELYETGSDLVFHNTIMTDSQKNEKEDFWEKKSYPPGLVSDPEKAVLRLLHGNYISGHTMLFKSSIRESILPIPEGRMYDRYIAILSTILYSVSDINEQLALHRYHDNQATEAKGPSRSSIEKIRRGIASGFSSNADPEWWGELLDTIEPIESSSMNIEKRFVKENIEDVRKYELNREQVYNEKEPLSTKLSGIYSNLSSGRYRRYGDVHPLLYIVKDLLGALFVHSSRLK